jgi:peptidoglycan/LPS O-acetylase OafA/YrhL
MSVTLFIVLTLVYIIQIANDTFNQYELWTYRFIMPFLFFNLLYLIKGYLSKSKILRKIGEYSFSIYLIHPLFCTFSYLLCMKYLELNLIYGIFIQIIVLVISYYISVLWHKITPLRKKTLPRDMKDIFNIKTSKE